MVYAAKWCCSMMILHVSKEKLQGGVKQACTHDALCTQIKPLNFGACGCVPCLGQISTAKGTAKLAVLLLLLFLLARRLRFLISESNRPKPKR